jgi:hypothetical protein
MIFQPVYKGLIKGKCSGFCQGPLYTGFTVSYHTLHIDSILTILPILTIYHYYKTCENRIQNVCVTDNHKYVPFSQ